MIVGKFGQIDNAAEPHRIPSPGVQKDADG
jgi:hypothetical protein